MKKVIREAKGFKKSFSQKIKTAEEIKKLIGGRPRKKKVVMCYGTFDIIHPGHIRQLIYAKSKGDILVVGLCPDEYATPPPNSPYVSQEVRALNLSAFEIVDYVFIDSKPPPPVKSIYKLQPDVFIKGFEHSLKGVNPMMKQQMPRTKAELEALKSYGGEMVFSPGDIDYSLTAQAYPQKPLALEQLSILMSAEKVSIAQLKKTVNKFKGLKIHVIGDTIVDKISRCTILGPSKDLAFSVRFDTSSSFVGGAGGVAKHLKSLGAQVTFTTILGKDEAAKFVKADLKKARVSVNALTDTTRPTTVKERFISEANKVLLQVDRVDNRIISEKLLKKISQIVKKTKTDAVLFSDYRHGIFNSETIPEIASSIPKGALKIADSQVSNRWGNILDFSGFDLITPNEKEARFALADQDTTIRPLAQKLYSEAGCRYLILTLGEEGIMTYRSPGMEVRDYFYISSLVDELVDAVGAGDTLLAASTLALAASGNIVQAAILGNLAAAIECSKMGNIPVSKQELLGAINNLREVKKDAKKRD